MKIKNITFTPGESIPAGQPLSGHEKLPQLTLADGSQILLCGFDPVAAFGGRHKRRALRLPTVSTRNQFGAWIAAEYNAQQRPRISSSLVREQLEKVAGMLDYIASAPRAGIEITKDDIEHARAQVKVAKYILQITKP